ncbi:DUF2461 domain-containing protein [Hufsiella ginkgonis]|uniref:TIGR02453 family protein n=1 Tax=Hufsiella ginkgonis TaxID=2695274 RepID=A0A7K1Y420_9SPHI|nr:DUF2461 domain-containing protein [Hufsiella ginkgonis]MXV17617.1 TIGR02453 family protein [Hufsiella ginkgonis]
MILPSTLTFLVGIAEHNDRDWFQDHKADYDKARENVLEFTRSVIRGIALFDATVPADLDPKSCVMRIYRDIRFSKNKTPYKNNFGIGISRQGKNFDGAGYYLHIQPGESFIAAGSWQPETQQLKAIRQEIDYNGADLLELLNNERFVKLAGDLSAEDQLKTMPKGYPADHPMIHYLKLKSFNAVANLPDSLLTGDQAAEQVVDMFETLHPLVVFLRNAVN